ncbi:hypothetical protein BGZ96_002602 [Linnemannia gamsii]|uniref:Uncharacterized protein n=1 Tax=Linnemannia gamsii TaxID=64522 RepID=A0ABQ7KGG5_9FUNG|nr:hypothetical protein BGZ96_002602 [Linnemannia gamsii]
MLISSGRTKTTQRLPLAVCALLALTLVLLFSPTTVVEAAPSEVIETCIDNGCNKVFSILDPCGGGATNETLQQSLIFTPTQALAGCQCNTEFFNAFSLCLSCIASQRETEPEIQNQQDWNRNCENYGFPVGPLPIVNSTNPINNGGSDDGSSNNSGVSAGAIVGIVVGVLVIVAALVGTIVFARRRRRNQKQEKSAVFEPASGSPNGSDHYNHAAATADTADHNDHAYQQQQEDYPATYQHNNYYNDQHAHYQDPSSDSYQNNNSYAAQQSQDNYYSNDFTNSNGNINGKVNGYYDTPNVGPHDTVMMQNLNTQSGKGGYVPPPPHPASPTHGSSSEVYATSPRSSDTFPHSLRNKPKTWGTPATSYVTQPLELTSGLIATEQHHPFGNHQHQASSSQFDDKTEFDDGEELEPPAPYSTDFPTRRSMTPPRATMQSYRDEFTRPSFEREPRRSGSDRGSISGPANGGGMGMSNMIRGSDNGSSGGYGFNNNSNNHVDYDQQGEQLDFARASQDSPESARRRARAAELFSAEGTRR